MLAKHPAKTQRTVGTHAGCQERRVGLPRRTAASRGSRRRIFGTSSRAKLLIAAFLSLLGAPPVHAASDAATRIGPPDKPIATSVASPREARVVYISGTGLADTGWLVEIEVTAAKGADK
jgi:hypothetical protein